MKWIISRYNHDISYLPEYTDDYVIYDRSDKEPIAPNAYRVANTGTDIYDKLNYIVDNYDNLPDVAVYTKANIFKYISKEEFDKIKDNKVFTPLLTQYHKTYLPVCWYENEMYCERNDYWYLYSHPAKYAEEIKGIFNMHQREYNKFAPGSNYILTKEDIHKHPKEFYETLMSFLDWDVYPGDAQLLERNLYYLWS